MKKIVILKHGGGELANQLWNYMSIYAAGLELGVPVKNPSFFEYHSCFRFLSTENLMTRVYALFYRTPRRRSHWINKVGRMKYSFISKMIALTHSACIFSSENSENKPTYVPPTSPLPPAFASCDTAYFSGWLFRNPQGLEKRRDDLVAAFRPADRVLDQVETIMGAMKKSGKKIIGIHIRQGDYKVFKNGAYWVPQARFREIVGEYLAAQGLSPADVSLFIASDGSVDEKIFAGFSMHVSKEDAVTDLFTLARTDLIIGSNSSFGAYAAWYGNVPQVIATAAPIDWDYYKDKKTYFDNRYLTLLAR